MDLLADYASSDEEGDAEAKVDERRPEANPFVAVPASRSSSTSSLLPEFRIPAGASGFKFRDFGEEEEAQGRGSRKNSFLSSIPPPKFQRYDPSTSDFDGESVDDEVKEMNPVKGMILSLPPPKGHSRHPDHASKPPGNPIGLDFSGEVAVKEEKKSNPAMFHALPKPKAGNPSSLQQSSKRLVNFILPLNPSALKSGDSDDEEDDEWKARKPAAVTSLTSGGLLSMLPAPKNSLCLAPNLAASVASSRRSALDTDIQAVEPEIPAPEEESSFVAGHEDYGNYEHHLVGGDTDAGMETSAMVSGWFPSHGGGEDDGNYVGNWSEGYVAGNGQDYGVYSGNWSGGQLETPADMRIVSGKRGRNDVPTQIVEVNQDELMKNRPREDQAKLTGIAFGPSYQPVSSGKGKPSKLHKRKHQIGSLYFDMKQKEMELAERRSRGLLTKSQTQGKYGW